MRSRAGLGGLRDGAGARRTARCGAGFAGVRPASLSDVVYRGRIGRLRDPERAGSATGSIPLPASPGAVPADPLPSASPRSGATPTPTCPANHTPPAPAVSSPDPKQRSSANSLLARRFPPRPTCPPSLPPPRSLPPLAAVPSKGLALLSRQLRLPKRCREPASRKASRDRGLKCSRHLLETA